MLSAVLLLTSALDPLGAAVDGPRPRQEVEQALASAASATASCVGAAMVRFNVLAAGVVDDVVLLDGSPTALACAGPTLRAMVMRDRGREPSTRVVVSLGALPLAPQQIHDALNSVRATAGSCLKDGTAPLELRLGIVVSERGDVRSVAIEALDSPVDATRRGCLERAFSRALFPRGRDAEVTIRWQLRVERGARRPGAPAGTLFSCLGITW